MSIKSMYTVDEMEVENFSTSCACGISEIQNAENTKYAHHDNTFHWGDGNVHLTILYATIVENGFASGRAQRRNIKKE